MSIQEDIQRLQDQLDLGYFGKIDGGAVNRVCDALEVSLVRQEHFLSQLHSCNKEFTTISAQLVQSQEALQQGSDRIRYLEGQVAYLLNALDEAGVITGAITPKGTK